MDLDSFLISILFDSNKTQESAKKIEDTINGLKNKIIGAFATIASIDFLKNAVEGSIKLATKLDNLSYTTNISKEDLNAWGEAVKRNGGTVDGFYQSVSSVSEKIREMQTNFGSAGQLVFARLGINLKDANGQIKNAVQIIGEIGDKFKNMPKVWQQNLGQQLGLDPATIRLISQGNEEALKLVNNMAKLGQINQLNTEKNIKLRNSLYDISLVFESMKITIANALIPIVQRFSEVLLKSLTYLQEHGKIVRGILVALAFIISGALVRALLSATIAMIRFTAAMLVNPITLITIALISLGLVIEDFVTYLRGGNSEFAEFYDWVGVKFKDLGNSDFMKGTTESFKWLLDIIKDINKEIRDFFGITQQDDPFMKDVEALREKSKENKKVEEGKEDKEVTKNTVESMARTAGFDPNVASTIAKIESGYDVNAKNPSSSASGVFQLTDDTAKDNGISDLSKKNEIRTNIAAGIKNLQNITKGLNKFLGRDPTGPEIYLGERLGLEGSKNLLSQNKDTMLSSLFSPEVLKANPQFKAMTAGQLINQSNKTYEQKSVTIGDVHVNAPNSNSKEISRNLFGELQKQMFSSFVTNTDNGIKL